MIRRKQMRMIKQKMKSDCAICCLSMLTGIPHRKVIKLVGDCFSPKDGLGDVSTSLLRLGLKQGKVQIGKIGYRIQPLDFRLLFRPHEISPSYFIDQLWGRRALLSVPSLNVKDGYHMVYWHYDKLYDPSNKKTYTDIEDLNPIKIVVFMEK